MRNKTFFAILLLVVFFSWLTTRWYAHHRHAFTATAAERTIHDE